jgi:integrase
MPDHRALPKGMEPGLLSREEAACWCRVTFHGLRHTDGARLGDLGVDPRTIAAMLGDKTLAMAIHYSEGTDRRLRASAAVASLEEAREKRK